MFRKAFTAEYIQNHIANQDRYPWYLELIQIGRANNCTKAARTPLKMHNRGPPHSEDSSETGFLLSGQHELGRRTACPDDDDDDDDDNDSLARPYETE